MLKIVMTLGVIVSYSWALNSYKSTRDDNWESNEYPASVVHSHLKVHATDLYLQIEEDITLEATIRSWLNGDPTTLEFFGEFNLPKEAIIRSSLLWFGDDILKANLLDPQLARDLFEDVVRREPQVITPTDASLIEQVDDTTYAYAIYPVEHGETRKMRIRYDIPWELNDSLRFSQLASAFHLGANNVKQTVLFTSELEHPLKISTYISSYTILPGYEYDISDIWIDNNNRAAEVHLSNEDNSQRIKEAHVESGELAGYYQDILLKVPETFKDGSNQMNTSQLKVSNAGVNQIVTLNTQEIREMSYYRFFIKSDEAWDGEIEWIMFNDEGDLAYNFEVVIDSVEVSDSSVVQLWADNQGLKLGNLLGYVDSRMSLLALEKDTLPEPLKTQYWDEGVPLLRPSELIVDFDEEVGSDFNDNTGVLNIDALDSQLKKWLSWEIVDHQLLITIEGIEFQGASVSAINLQGQIIQNQSLELGLNRFDLPNLDQSHYVLVVTQNQKQYTITP